MTDFEKALNFTLGNEGGYSNHPKDKGGPTNMGITQAKLNNAFARHIVSHNDVKKLTRAEAARIYETDYWLASGADILPFPLCALHFDAAVNHGCFWAKKFLQRALNAYYGSQLAVDGIIGPATKRAVAQIVSENTARKIGDIYCDVRQKYFDAIVRNNPSQKVFSRGWTNRVARCRDFARDEGRWA